MKSAGASKNNADDIEIVFVLEQNHRSTDVKSAGASKNNGDDVEIVFVLEQNHRSTDIKSAGARMNHKAGSGAKSSFHRREVGGGADES